jgi:hypothetical protein
MGKRGSRDHIRRDRSLRRRPGTNRGRPVLLIVCEGETEQEYFEALKRKYRIRSTQVVVSDNLVGSSPISVVKCALSKYADFPTYDHVYCVFDRDAHADFDRARQQIRRASTRRRNPTPLREAVSVPCVELWFLLHKVYSAAPYANFDAIRPVLRGHIPGYEKADRAIADELVQHVEVAIANAERLVTQANSDGFQNPYTTVHLLAKYIISLAGV